MRALLLVLIVAGCAHADVAIHAGSPPAPPAHASVHVSASGPPALLIVAAVLLISAFHQTGDPAATSAPMSPDRAVQEHDCTQPVTFTGNLKCR